MYPQVFGKYVLERELARGGMARVLLATLRGADGFEKRLVVKQIRDELAIDDEFVARFVDEAKTTVALSHPNIVPVYELGVEQGIYFLAMELVEGATVAELLEHGGKLTPEEGAYLGVEICRGLDYAHRRMQVVHRDITPRNVMVDEEGQVKLIDFGIAARAASAAAKKVFGSPGHMPPEQMRGEEVGPGADLFAAAVLLLEAWSGRAPFRRATLEACEEAMRGPHPCPGDSDDRLRPLDEVLGRATALDPADRPKDAEELGRALRRYLQSARVDAGDVARSLAERARAAKAGALARRRAAATSADADADADAHPGETTATFAAREELGEATRRLTDATPAERIETVATRPLETPARPEAGAEREAVRSAGGGHGARTARAAIAAAALGALAFVGARSLSPSLGERSAATSPAAAPPSPSPSPSPATAAAAPATAAIAPTPSTARAAIAPATTTVTTPTPAARADAPPLASSPGAPASAHPARAKAALVLYGEPGTRVTVDGVDRGACPVTVAVDPGGHDVRFAFEPTGESRGQRVEVDGTERVRLRADFTSAAPTVHVER